MTKTKITNLFGVLLIAFALTVSLGAYGQEEMIEIEEEMVEVEEEMVDEEVMEPVDGEMEEVIDDLDGFDFDDFDGFDDLDEWGETDEIDVDPVTDDGNMTVVIVVLVVVALGLIIFLVTRKR